MMAGTWTAGRTRRITVVTGSRADYGHLRQVMLLLRDHPSFELKVVACGMHLAPQFGSTWREIERDGFTIDARVDLQLSGDSRVAAVKSSGLGMIGFADALQPLEPDLVVLLGDRYEILAAGVAAAILGLPIAHLHGGELTFGAFDEAIRHALTKLSQLHFVAAEPYRQRVIQLGEAPERVFAVGAPGLDNMAAGNGWSRAATLDALGLSPDARYLLVTLHPVTADPASDLPTAHALVAALAGSKGMHIVLTGVNADPGHATVERVLADFAASAPDRVHRFASLGPERYVAAIRHSLALIGNSSSGIIEAPAIGTPSVNIGDRQAGRLRARSVVDCGAVPDEIAAAIAKALTPETRRIAETEPSPYGGIGASQRLVDVLAALPEELMAGKRFFDLPAGIDRSAGS